MKSKSHNITITALFSAVICILSVVTIPIGPIPLSLSLFAVILSSTVLNVRQSFLAVILYILVGAIGIPVFSGFKGGFYVLFDATGGFIFSYIPVAFINSFISYKTNKKTPKFIGAILSLIPLYLFGTLQYSVVCSQDFKTSFAVCVLPFVAFDILKAISAVGIGIKLKKTIK